MLECAVPVPRPSSVFPEPISPGVTRWEHADVIDRHHRCMANDTRGIMDLRGSLVEHPPFPDAEPSQVLW